MLVVLRELPTHLDRAQGLVERVMVPANQLLAGYLESRIDPEDMKRILFEWAYPRIARHCRDRRTPYPSLREDGGLPQFSFR